MLLDGWVTATDVLVLGLNKFTQRLPTLPSFHSTSVGIKGNFSQPDKKSWECTRNIGMEICL